MATERHDKDYGDRTIYRVIILMSALMGVGVFIIPNSDKGSVTTTGWVLITLFAVILVVGGIWAGCVQGRYKCPQCGARLPMMPPEASTKFQHRFHCPACDVIWTTNIYAGDL